MALKKALTDIADKIRSRTGKTDKLSLAAMPAEIENVYEAGQKNEKDKTDIHVERSKKAIIGRGGEIASDAGIEALSEAIFNIPADASLAHYTDDEIAYQKNVPTGAEEYALLKSVGGMTYKSNNLLPYPYHNTTKTENGITFTDNGDGTITVNGTPTQDTRFSCSKFTVKVGKEYFISGCPKGGSETTYYLHLRGFDLDLGTGALIRVSSKDFTNNVEIVIKSGTTVSNLTFKPMLNEGATALPYEPYYEGLRDSKVTEIVSVGSNLIPSQEYGRHIPLSIKAGTTITVSSGNTVDDSMYLLFYDKDKVKLPTNAHLSNSNGKGRVYATVTLSQDCEWVMWAWAKNTTVIEGQVKIGTGTTEYTPYREPITHPIPKAVQDLDGYGWGINADCYNYVDWEKRQFVKCVERADMGTFGWWETSGVVSRFGSPLEKLAKPTGSYNVAVNAICSAYPNITQNSLFANNTGVSVQALTANNVYVYDANYTDTTAFKAAMSGVMLYYELAEPIITDISDILTDDNFIEVESGGTLEFANEHKYAVPSTVKYTIKVGG